ncbi:nitroreductase family protein [Deinococcus aquaticus]|uniref:nitroreductase family protein n=1 Tax=Deinococcus aquaticus TaxID=328692 RepID=UPI003F464C5F
MPVPDSAQDRAALWRVMEARRDHRHFRPDPVPPELLARVLDAFRVAPSVGLIRIPSVSLTDRDTTDLPTPRPEPVPLPLAPLGLNGFASHSIGTHMSQPWQVTVIREPARRAQVHASFAQVRARERLRFSGERRDLYDTLKLEGILDAPLGLLVSLDSPDGPTLGTGGLSGMLEASVLCAVTLAWLAATAEGLGLGWLSLVDGGDLGEWLDLAPGTRPLAYLCLGWPALTLDAPLLETTGWARRTPLRVNDTDVTP